MRRRGGGIGGDFLPHSLHDPDHFLPIGGVHERIVGLRPQPHAVHDEEPAQLDEHLVTLVEDAAGALDTSPSARPGCPAARSLFRSCQYGVSVRSLVQ